MTIPETRDREDQSQSEDSNCASSPSEESAAPLTQTDSFDSNSNASGFPAFSSSAGGSQGNARRGVVFEEGQRTGVDARRSSAASDDNGPEALLHNREEETSAAALVSVGSAASPLTGRIRGREDSGSPHRKHLKPALDGTRAGRGSESEDTATALGSRSPPQATEGGTAAPSDAPALAALKSAMKERQEEAGERVREDCGAQDACVSSSSGGDEPDLQTPAGAATMTAVDSAAATQAASSPRPPSGLPLGSSQRPLSSPSSSSSPLTALAVPADDDDAEEEEDDEEPEGEQVVLVVKWCGKLYDVALSPSDFECFSVADFKERLQQQLSVPADKQKLLGFTNAKGGTARDADLLTSLRFQRERQMMLVGSTDAQLLAAAQAHAAALAQGDKLLDDFAAASADVLTEDELRTPLHLSRLETAIERTQIHLLHPPRPGKKLLVLDLDYTLFDCKSLAGSIDDLKRPFLEQFMQDVFQDYDIAVWSQTHWKWVEMKCTELGFLTSSKFHLCFVLDRSSMFTVCSRRKKKRGRGSSRDSGGELRTHEVKALELIWRKFPGFWSASNTVHVDDLSRNFVFNPKNGIKVSAYKREKRDSDAELLLLGIYLKHLAQAPDVREVPHKYWKVRAAEEARRGGSLPESLHFSTQAAAEPQSD
ncbi:HAD hydrolase, family IIID protein [Besnoitia besnoiti]|uniref:protein-serine/threonine phosphatase n=1 Tax=Besnoitia besnoiti TaxID=94643 RepID=A0A2A9MDS9_BESBE|nr:HAD hydrolase, family IIID protein [Besnoitia besnoiti]PFH33787.1 HAD hydrolase, family IIID protein [Besnoitia besnoiti]